MLQSKGIASVDICSCTAPEMTPWALSDYLDFSTDIEALYIELLCGFRFCYAHLTALNMR